MKAFLRWWLMFCIFIIAGIGLQQFGYVDGLYYADQSKLSFVILAVFFAVSSYIGLLTYRKMKDVALFKTSKEKELQLENCWFVANECQTVGLIGTVIGFLMMLSSAFANLDITVVTTVQEAIKFMALGMSTALVTTLVGMVCGLLLKLQLINIDERT
jgi:flagellar motor component MotA